MTTKKENVKVENTEIKVVSIATGEVITLTDTQKILTIRAKEFTAREKGNKFMTYKAVQKNGDLLTSKFTRASKFEVEDEGQFSIIVEKDDMNIDSFTKTFPVLWIRKVIEKVEIIKDNTKRHADIDERF